MQATSARLNSGGCPTLGSFSRGSQKPGQVSRCGEPPRSRWEFSLKRRGRERESTRGEPDFQETSSRSWSEKLVHPLLFRKAFYTFGCTQRSMDNTKYAASAALTLIKTRLSLCIPSCIHKSQVIYINCWPKGLLAFYGPFLIRFCQPENLFALIVLFFPKSGATLRKH